MKIGVLQKGSLVGKIIELAKWGGNYHLLHLRTRGKRRTALFRLIQANEEGMNYHEFILARRPDGQVRAVDAYIYLSGELLTETFRREAIKATAPMSQGFLDRLVGADKEYARNLEKIQGVFKLFNEGHPREALDAYRALPSDAHRKKSWSRSSASRRRWP